MVDRQWRSQGAGDHPLAETLPPESPQMKLHFVQRSMESRHFESQSAPCSPLSPPCRPSFWKVWLRSWIWKIWGATSTKSCKSFCYWSSRAKGIFLLSRNHCGMTKTSSLTSIIHQSSSLSTPHINVKLGSEICQNHQMFFRAHFEPFHPRKLTINWALSSRY